MGSYSISQDMFNDMSTWVKDDGSDATIFYGCNDEFCCQN